MKDKLIKHLYNKHLRTLLMARGEVSVMQWISVRKVALFQVQCLGIPLKHFSILIKLGICMDII